MGLSRGHIFTTAPPRLQPPSREGPHPPRLRPPPDHSKLLLAVPRATEAASVVPPSLAPGGITALARLTAAPGWPWPALDFQNLLCSSWIPSSRSVSCSSGSSLGAPAPTVHTEPGPPRTPDLGSHCPLAPHGAAAAFTHAPQTSSSVGGIFREGPGTPPLSPLGQPILPASPVLSCWSPSSEAPRALAQEPLLSHLNLTPTP